MTERSHKGNVKRGRHVHHLCSDLLRVFHSDLSKGNCIGSVA
jgi:hypothetical protein